jgi:hypothetical protein
MDIIFILAVITFTRTYPETNPFLMECRVRREEQRTQASMKQGGFKT